MSIRDPLQMVETAVDLRWFAQTGRLTAVRHAGPGEDLSLHPNEKCFAIVRLETTKFIKHLVGLRRLFLPMLSDELGATAMFEYLETDLASRPLWGRPEIPSSDHTPVTETLKK